MSLLNPLVFKLWSWMNTHKTNVSAHHIKYSDAEALAASENGLSPESGFSVRNSVVQTIPTAVWTKIQYNTIVFDIDTEFSLASERFIATREGYYQINIVAVLMWLADGKKWIIECRKNGVAVFVVRGVVGGVEYVGGCATGVVHLNVGDYLEAWFYHNNGSDRSLTDSLGYSVFSGIKIR